MRTTLTLDDALLAAAREVAHHSARSVGDVISEWARNGLRAAAAPTQTQRTTGFPVFTVPPEAPPITSQTVRRLMNDEGLPARR
jgi:hypothetical protein